jgi:hypothetical protein
MTTHHTQHRCPLTLRTAVAVALAAILLGCEPPTEHVTQVELAPLEVSGWAPGTILPGSTIVIRGEGFLPPEAGKNFIRIAGKAGERPVNVEVDASFESETELRYTPGPELLGQLQVDGPPLKGTMRVSRVAEVDGSGSWYEFPISLAVRSNLDPQVEGLLPEVLHPGELVTVVGGGFLLPGEGTSAVVFDGTFTTTSPPTTRTYANVFIPATATSREALQFRLTPDLFGIKPGTLEGAVRVVNDTEGGATRESPVLDGLTLPLERPFVSSVTPNSVSRGQILRFEGRGFLPTDAAFQASTLLLVEGSFTSKAGKSLKFQGLDALSLFPDSITDNTSMEYVLRVSMDLNGQMTGLGLVSGTLKGTVTPWVLSGSDAVLGKGVPFEVRVLPQRQVVWVKYLPGFSESLAHFGLAAVERSVRDRILEIAARDYVDVNIAFQEEKPTDFAEFGIVEVGGADPNGADLFGLDNTQGKDVGNVRFNDIIGGLNAETEEQGYYGYGGVFVESFLGLSPGLDQGSLPIRDQRFDDIFAVFIPDLGGQPVAEGEYPGGSRDALIGEAVRVLGNLVGNTITHEVGHSLGLSAIDGEFHNVGDNPGWIMDSGSFRPFAERAEIDGYAPAVFSPFNRAYLQSVLPVE